MKKLKVILVILAVLIWSLIFSLKGYGQDTISAKITPRFSVDTVLTRSGDFKDTGLSIDAEEFVLRYRLSKRELEFDAVAGALLLIELFKTNNPEKELTLKNVYQWQKQYFEEVYKD